MTRRWLVGVRTLPNNPARVLRVLPVKKHEVALAAQIMIDEGDDAVFVFTRKVSLKELAPVIASGKPIMGTFGKDIETLYHNR